MTDTGIDTGTRRDRRRARTQRDLVATARALIAQNGLAALKVSEIAERADVALGTFYAHFPGKDDVVNAVIAQTITDIADAVGSMGDHLDDPATALAFGIHTLMALLVTDPELMRLLTRLDDAERRFEQMIWPQAQAITERGIASGRFHTSNPTLALTMASGAIFAAIRAGLDDRTDVDADTVCATILQSLGVDHEDATAITREAEISG